MRTANALHRPHTPRDPDRGRLTRRLMSGGGPPRGPAVPRPTGEGTSAGATFLGGVVSLALTVSAFLAYGLCASAVYIANDLLDLESDRQHPRKRERPFAAGRVPLSVVA